MVEVLKIQGIQRAVWTSADELCTMPFAAAACYAIGVEAPLRGKQRILKEVVGS